MLSGQYALWRFEKKIKMEYFLVIYVKISNFTKFDG